MKASGPSELPFDVLGSAEIRTPYRFEAGRESSKAGTPESSFLLGELTWPEAQERFRQMDVALLPVGAPSSPRGSEASEDPGEPTD